MDKLTPMMQQFKNIKNEYPDAILFFRVGDFYEMFFDDAVTASRELEIALTSREGKKKGAIPLAGIPYHAAPGYLGRLLEKGYKVAICEQVEEAGKGKGLVKREVTRVITPGTVVEEDFLQKDDNNYLASIAREGDDFGLAFVDISTGEIQAYFFENGENCRAIEKVKEQIDLLQPAEIIVDNSFSREILSKLNLEQKNFNFMQKDASCFNGKSEALKYLEKFFPGDLLKDSGLKDCQPALFAVTSSLDYIRKMQRGSLEHLHKIKLHRPAEALYMDAVTVRNLEIFEALYSRQKKNSLWGVLNRTKTAMGARLLRRWLERPLLEQKALKLRWNAVEELKTKQLQKDELAGFLKQCYDLERLSGKISLGYINPRDLLALKKTLLLLPPIKQILEQMEAERLIRLSKRFPDLSVLLDKLEKALKDDAPLALKEGGIFKDGYSPVLDELRQITRDSKQWLLELEEKERERSGIKSLKIGFNKVFGYYLEVTRVNLENVPENYIRRQTLVNSERFVTEELKAKEALILNAEEKLIQLEYDLFEKLRLDVGQYIPKLQQAGQIIAEADCFFSLADLASSPGYVKPKLSSSRRIEIRGGRHPVVECLQETPFIPNDIFLDDENEKILMITGPNMAGKSTYCRSIALILLLAQIGSFVPATGMHFYPVERIFARVGASDDLSGGRSTFMVEMEETASILMEAAPNSLVILDEIGRGTSTYDGMSLAQAILEYLHGKPAVHVLFSTHYHELTALEGKLKALKNLTVSVKEKGEEIIFLRKIVSGKADKSYGVNVARLAGLPPAIIARAYQILEGFEAQIADTVAEKATDTDYVSYQMEKQIEGKDDPVIKSPVLFEDNKGQLSLLPASEKKISSTLTDEENKIIEEIKQLNIVNVTPLEALNKLYRLQSRLLSLGKNSGERIDKR